MMTSFKEKLVTLLNTTCQENKSNTPDYILADYIGHVLDAFNEATCARTKWYGHNDKIGADVTTKSASAVAVDAYASIIELADLPKEDAKAAFALAKEQLTAPPKVLSALEVSDAILFLTEEINSLKSTLSKDFKEILNSLSPKK